MNSPVNALRSARQALGYRSQQDLADALSSTARDIGLRIAINGRTVRRWESDNPPWPQSEHIQALEALFRRPITELGFTASRRAGGDKAVEPASRHARESWAARHSGGAAGALPQSVAADFMSVTASFRRLYWSLPADRLERLVADHAGLGWDLLPQIPGAGKELMARAVSEAALLAGRLEFFDLQQPDIAKPSFALAVKAAYQANDDLLGAAALAHTAFGPAFSGDPDQAEKAREQILAARTFARRGNAGPEMLAWLDAVEAEVETRFGDAERALLLIENAELVYAAYNPETSPSPAWLDWFSPARLAGFKGNTQIAAGHAREARETLAWALNELPPEAVKQRAILHADLAAAAVLEGNPELACEDLGRTLEILGEHWYATAMDRVKVVRQSLREWDSAPCVRTLDDQLYNWHTMIRSLNS